MWGVCFVGGIVVWICVWDGVDDEGDGWDDVWDWFWVCFGEGCEFCWFCCCCCWMLEGVKFIGWDLGWLGWVWGDCSSGGCFKGIGIRGDNWVFGVCGGLGCGIVLGVG